MLFRPQLRPASSLHCVTLVAVIWMSTALVGARVAAQTPPLSGSNGGETAPPAPAVDPQLAARLASPQATMRTFLDAMDDNRRSDAVNCLDLSALEETTARAKGESYAVMLKGILDRTVWINLDELSSDPNDPDSFVLGNYAYDLAPEDKADADKIRIERGPDGLWRFSANSVAALDDMWVHWEDRPLAEGIADSSTEETFDLWLRRQFPKPLRETQFLLPNYQWLCLLVLIFVGFVADFLSRAFLRMLTHWWFRYFRSKEIAEQEKKLWKPVGLFMQALVWYGGTTLIGLPASALMVLLVGLKIFAVVAGVWTAFLFINLLSAYFAERALTTRTKFDDLLIPMVSRTLKVFAVCVGIITCAQAFNLPIWGLLTSLSIGGFALALASQDAVSNFFGSVTVLLDRPFEIGDWVIVDGDIEGTVETVGFRSTRIRTFYNSLITVPNSKLTTATVDNMGRRRYRRVKTMLGLQYDTTPDQIEAFCEGVREIIRRHPFTRKDYYHVYLNAFSGSSLDILLYCFVKCPDWSVELREKQRLFLDIIRLADKLGVQFAFPTRTLHMFNEQKPTGDLPVDLANPLPAGGRLGAELAGPPHTPESLPGPVEFTGPTKFDDA